MIRTNFHPLSLRAESRTHFPSPRTFNLAGVLCIAALASPTLLSSSAPAQQVDWIVNTGNFCTAGNWSTGLVPDFNREVFIGRSSATPNVILNCDALVRSLTMQGASTLSTSGRQLAMFNDFTVSESGGNSVINVSPYSGTGGTSALIADNLFMNAGTSMNLFDGALVHFNDVLNIAANAQVSGRGTLDFANGPSARAIVNNGRLLASGGTLTIESDRPVDLDGTSGDGILRVTSAESQMRIFAPLPASDAFSGLIDIAPGNWIQFTTAFAADGDVTMSGLNSHHAELIAPSMTFHSGSTVLVTSGVSHLQSSSIVWRSGASIDVPTGAQLLINCPTIDFNSGAQVQIGGRLSVNGTTLLRGATLNGAELISVDDLHAISGNSTISMPTGQFNWDGVANNAQTTVNAGASLSITAPRINYTSTGGNNDFSGSVINRGNLAVNSLGLWKLKGVMQLQRLSTSEPLPMLSGSDIELTGRIEGTGIVESADVTASGIISPGAAPTTGRLHFSRGTLTLGQANTIEIDIGGATQVTQYDHVLASNAGNISQTTNLGGTLRVRLANGFVPVIGQQFNIIEGHTLSGQFHAIDAPGFDIQIIRITGSTLDRVVATYAGSPCPADMVPAGPPTGDGVVDINDLLAVINAWGSCPQSTPLGCTGDCSPLGGDGQVNVDDLLAVITAWGACD